MRIMQKRTYTKLMLTIIITSLLITPILSASAKKYDESGIIPSYPVTKKVIRFEESIPISSEVAQMYGYPSDFTGYYTVNVYGVDVGKGVVLIDSGDDDLANELYKSVTHAFNKPILAVYLTHYHSDHAGGGLCFKNMGIPVYAPENEIWFIEQGADVGSNIPSDFTYEGYTPIAYNENDLYHRFEVIPEPGHTGGQVSIAYRHGHTKYLFSADTILPMEPALDPFDLTYLVTHISALETYSQAPSLTALQILTLNGMIDSVSCYDYILTGHANVMDPTTTVTKIGYTIWVLENLPVLPFM